MGPVGEGDGLNMWPFGRKRSGIKAAPASSDSAHVVEGREVLNSLSPEVVKRVCSVESIRWEVSMMDALIDALPLTGIPKTDVGFIRSSSSSRVSYARVAGKPQPTSGRYHVPPIEIGFGSYPDQPCDDLGTPLAPLNGSSGILRYEGDGSLAQSEIFHWDHGTLWDVHYGVRDGSPYIFKVLRNTATGTYTKPREVYRA